MCVVQRKAAGTAGGRQPAGQLGQLPDGVCVQPH